MFSQSAQYYDDIYLSMKKDYAAEAEKVHKFIQKYKKSGGVTLLDVACGTGLHAGFLNEGYHVEGLDLDLQMLSIARHNHPSIRFHHGDMVDFYFKKRFDAIVCLFSSIGYVRTKTRLRQAIRNMSEHLVAGGVLLIEPWFTPEQWNVGTVSLLTVERPEYKIVRMSHSARKGNISIVDFHYLIGESKKIEYANERHELGLFTDEEYREAFRVAELKTYYHAKGLDGRGLYIGVK